MLPRLEYLQEWRVHRPGLLGLQLLLLSPAQLPLSCPQIMFSWEHLGDAAPFLIKIKKVSTLVLVKFETLSPVDLLAKSGAISREPY